MYCFVMAAALMLLANLPAQAQNVQQDGSKARIDHYAVHAVGQPDISVSSSSIDGAAGSSAPAGNAIPNDPAFKQGYHWSYKPLPAGMNAVGAWQKTTGLKDVVVAVLSSGIFLKHPDIAHSPNVLPGYSFVVRDGQERKPDATDPGEDCLDGANTRRFEGTHLAGTIGAARTNNGMWVSGLNWAVSILPIRVESKCSVGESDLGAAIFGRPAIPLTAFPSTTTRRTSFCWILRLRQNATGPT